MAKRLQEYVKYTKKELESYTKQEGSCVRKINSNLHLSLGPYCLADFKHALSAHIMRRKVGYYDASLEGIVLDIKNIKVLGTAAALRSDDPRIHVDVNADCYVFRPIAGAILSGVVKHVGNHHIGVIIYRVFNVSIRFAAKINKEEFKMDDSVRFRIKNFNLQNVFPYIEGDLVTANGDKILDKFIKTEPDSADSTHDSGIEERDNQDLDELVSLIKEEKASDVEEVADKSKKQKTNATKSKRKSSESVETPKKITKIKEELSSDKKKSKTTQSIGLNSTETVKITPKSKTKKVNGELLDEMQIKTENDDVNSTPAKKRKTKKNSISSS
ncbi:probable DNA-directed RNA polymerase I subunit RPA43 [Ceratitis capitata]|uniref:(Mediterranean fruit fly) hypothetical protein n=1 Tax=Ceratitis capitata TaxID=7213 RepID=A0A811UJ66_CERCA|nr:probable DNA-directed RNA polymerase I subunit RPA43 [Ceratitis capitata]CAD6997877.1 unnamed protein product [Ceratitis capitata]